ncbi:MAG: HupE/UreJ family protein, partial [Acidobacteriota bacterium]|nr:HupE/UreJ family protein [Acidobacteriota bacterium]
MLDITPKKVGMELEIPLSELELAVGHNLTESPEESIKNFEPQLKEYLLSHIRPVSENSQPWSIEITKIKVEKAEQTQSGTFQEIRVNLDLTPP